MEGRPWQGRRGWLHTTNRKAHKGRRGNNGPSMEAIQLHQGRDGDVEVFRFRGEAIKRPCRAMPDGRRSHTPRPYGHTWRPLPRVQALQPNVAPWKNLNYTSCRHASNVRTRGAILPHEEEARTDGGVGPRRWLPPLFHCLDAADLCASPSSTLCRSSFSLAMISPGVSGLPWVPRLILARKARDSDTSFCLVAQGPLISQ